MTESAVIAPAGELDVDSIDALVPQLDEAVAADYPRLILDLSAVTLVDSSAFGAIMQVQHRFNGQGRTLAVVAPHGSAAAVRPRADGVAVALLGVPLARCRAGMSGAPRPAADDGSGAGTSASPAGLSDAAVTDMLERAAAAHAPQRPVGAGRRDRRAGRAASGRATSCCT